MRLRFRGPGFLFFNIQYTVYNIQSLIIAAKPTEGFTEN